eukprot:Hpha_TRINITY_DN12561_c0_g1::TRINITY_DN12561_c0_g1_i1::g.51170::m.51170/K00108/betA, CHDH; choline dehydrogenase
MGNCCSTESGPPKGRAPSKGVGGSSSKVEGASSSKGVGGLSFDYIIVGSGPAGCVVANRLSKDPSVSVCLVETGDDNEPLVHEANKWFVLKDMPEHHYGIVTPKQPGCADREMELSTAHLAGGCGSHNACQYVRCSPFDYASWNCGEGWTWEGLLPHFRSIENFVHGGDAAVRGQEGEMRVRNVGDLTPAAEAFVEHATDEAFPFNHDYNDGKQYGLSRVQTNVSPEGTRHGPYHAFIAPILKERKNLTVLFNTRVTRVVFNKDKRATGVETSSKDHPFLSVNKDVVLTASAYLSPQLLMLSGVGPRQHLEETGIPVVHDAPGVGNNLSDHLHCVWYYKFEPDTSIPDHTSCVDWAQLHGFAAVDGTVEEHRPDFQIYFLANEKPLSEDGPMPEEMKGDGHKKTFAIVLSNLHAHSRGTVRLASKDPLQNPVVDPRFMSDERDEEMWRQICAWMRARVEKFGSKYPHQELWPKGLGIEDDVVWVRNAAMTMWHPVGTLSMAGGEASVVDPKTMKVRGVEGVRVADASVIPETPSGNTHVPVMVTASRAAELIARSR